MGQLILQPDAAAGKDTYCNGQAGRLDYNYGVAQAAIARHIDKLLFRFNLSSIPAGAVATSVTFYLTCTTSATYSGAHNLYLVAAADGDWIEGTNSGAAGVGEPCYNWKAYNTVAWAAAGGPSAGTLLSTLAVRMLTGVEYAFPWTDPTQIHQWFGQATNNGLLFIGHAGTPYIAMSDYPTPAWRPKLVIDYTLPGGGYGIFSAPFAAPMRGPFG